ncbi:DUF3553 domain-containing protein [Massilia sp. DWR3-1-1]|uniref:DUF3553 domain-containing protein n=1 Tax=Massilia sp. DWR3-1-1 TaxID=2804559 RepID=UPI003CEFE7F1
MNSTAPAPPRAAPRFAPGDAVRVPKYADGVVQSSAGEQVTIVFSDQVARTFMADFVTAV